MIYVDSCIAIYWVEENPICIEPLRIAFSMLPIGDMTYSPLVKLECLVYPYRQGNSGLIERYQRFFASAVCLSLSDEIFDDAARLRAAYPNLKTPDALHLACSQYYSCSALWTNDDRLYRTVGGYAVNICGK